MTKEIVFTLPSEAVGEATEGLLLGDFNNWDADKGFTLKKQKDGSLKAVVQLEAGIYQYRYLLNDGRWVNDYQAQKYVPVSGFHIDNCLITVPEAFDTDQETKPKTRRVKNEKLNAGVEKAKAEKAKIGKAATGKSAIVKAPSPRKAATTKAATGKTETGKTEKKK